jgi:hypothetical protein
MTEKADRPGTGLRRLHSLGDDGVEHLLRRHRLGEPRGHGLKPVCTGGGRFRLSLHLTPALEQVRDEDGHDEEERHSCNLVAVFGNEIVPRRGEEERQSERREDGCDEPWRKAAQVRRERGGQQVEEARHLRARPVRLRIERGDRRGRQERRRPPESGR